MSTLAILASGALLCANPSVHDGDTLRCGAERIRIANIDAPELRDSPKCQDYRRAYADCDFKVGIRARDRLRALLAQGRATIVRQGTDQYGRTLARIRVNGRDVGEQLVAERLARRWR